MIKFKHFLLVGLLILLCYSCGSDGNSVNNFNHAAQAVKDNDSIVKFLKSHYFDDGKDSIRSIDNNQTSLFKDSRLKNKTVKEYGLDYTYYYFVIKQGTPKKDKGFPTIVDSILPVYKLRSLTNASILKKEQDLTSPKWFDPVSIAVRGWLYGFTHFKNGDNLTKDGPITYVNGGKGFFLLPSGLSYRNSKTLTNKNLLYYVELYDFVKDTDHDNDNVPSIKEDIDGDGNPWNDDTDKDRIPNFRDADDDGDGKLTKDEDANGDGDPTNDFSDKNNPTLPDYLNRKIF